MERDCLPAAGAARPMGDTRLASVSLGLGSRCSASVARACAAALAARSSARMWAAIMGVITDAIAAGEYFQMQTFAQSLIELVLTGQHHRAREHVKCARSAQQARVQRESAPVAAPQSDFVSMIFIINSYTVYK